MFKYLQKNMVLRKDYSKKGIGKIVRLILLIGLALKDGQMILATVFKSILWIQDYACVT